MSDTFLQRWRAVAGGRCALCRGWSDGGVCAACRATFAPVVARCGRCALALPAGAAAAAAAAAALPSSPPARPCMGCRRRPPPWHAAVAACDYGPPWDALVAAFKFRARPDLAAVLAPLLAAAVPRNAASGSGRPLVVPVPVAPDRLRERGYNQSWELARRVARAHALPACADALFRVRATGHQLQLGRAERAANLRDAFVVTPSRATRVRGAHVALVDDVLTTGATADAATRALLRAGAARVHVWVLARTP